MWRQRGPFSTEERANLHQHALPSTRRIARSDVDAFRDVVNSAPDERAIQTHLTEHPHLWQSLSGGEQPWVLPKVRFGGRYEADFLVASESSLGIEWIYVELESPQAAAFTKAGQYAEKARTGIFQIQSWREFIRQNGGYACRSPSDGGLGLPGLRPKDGGLVLIGRRGPWKDPAELRRQSQENDRIAVRSYDWLLERMEVLA
jgi:antiviral defense system Shedu protein SduA